MYAAGCVQFAMDHLCTSLKRKMLFSTCYLLRNGLAILCRVHLAGKESLAMVNAVSTLCEYSRGAAEFCLIPVATE